MIDASEFVSELRKRHQLTQAELAARAHIAQATISRVESRKQIPKIETLDLLAASCGEEVALVSVPTSGACPGRPASPH